MTGAAADRKAEAKANELYWGSDESVNQIAENLDVSKGMLYGMIRPLPTGLTCPACNEELVYPNRTARDRSRVACAVCGWEGPEADAGDATVAPPPGEDEDVEEVPSTPLFDTRTRTIVGGALLGAAAGLALVLWARRR